MLLEMVTEFCYLDGMLCDSAVTDFR